MEKNAMLTENSCSDYDNTKKAAYYDAEGYTVADEANKHQLKNPCPVVNLTQEEQE